MQDKGLAKLGDNLVNLLYSIAKSRAIGEPTGWKVSAKVLSTALKQSPFYKVIPRRASMHDLGDFFEALCAHAWLTKAMTLNEMQEILYLTMKEGNFSTRKNEEIVAGEAFFQLLNGLRKNYDF
ncbi:MAG: ribonuclease III family protein [Candidatus Helarchaeota archaeon]